jgi:hypothetical protein
VTLLLGRCLESVEMKDTRIVSATMVDLINHEGKTMDRNELSESGGKVWDFGD